MHFITLYVSYLYNKIKKNKRIKKTYFAGSGKSVRSGIPHLASYIITQLHSFSVEK